MDFRGMVMAEQEHSDRLAAVKAEYEKEIERLRADLLTADGQAKKLQGEVARLREELQDSREAAEDWKQRWRRVRDALGE